MQNLLKTSQFISRLLKWEKGPKIGWRFCQKATVEMEGRKQDDDGITARLPKMGSSKRGVHRVSVSMQIENSSPYNTECNIRTVPYWTIQQQPKFICIQPSTSYISTSSTSSSTSNCITAVPEIVCFSHFIVSQCHSSSSPPIWENKFVC